MSDHNRWQREEDVKRLETYSDLGGALVTFGNFAWRISAAQGLVAGGNLPDPEAGLLDSAAAESETNVNGSGFCHSPTT
jgi:hypothetical protein